MKRRLFLLLGASTMALTSLAGFSVASPTPAAAAPSDPLVAIGYIIDCLTLDHLITDFGPCLVNAIEKIVSTLSLPTSLGANSLPKLPTKLSPGTNAPTLSLPTKVHSIIDTLPPALHTTPVASLPAVQAPIKNLIPTRAKSSSAKALPKLPALTDIKFLNASDSKASSNPVSSTDAVGIAALVLLGAGALTYRRRAGAVAS
jgi:hypothetical protein